MKHQYELRHFRYFQEVAKELNFHRAAENLYITQPGLTRQIQQLEEYLEAKLFERTKRKVTLTPAGKYLHQEIDAVFNHIKNLVEHTHQIGEGIEGYLRIGFVGSAMQSIIPKVLVELHDQHPDIHTKLEEIPNNKQVELLQQNLLDVAFVRLKHFPKGIEHQVVFQDSFSLVLPENHWLDEKIFRSLDQLRDESFILFDADYSQDYYNQVMNIFNQAGFSPKVDHKSVHANTIFRLIEHGLGVAIIPSTLFRGFSIPLKCIELKSLNDFAELSMAWSKNSPNPAMANFISVANSMA